MEITPIQEQPVKKSLKTSTKIQTKLGKKDVETKTGKNQTNYQHAPITNTIVIYPNSFKPIMDKDNSSISSIDTSDSDSETMKQLGNLKKIN